MDNKKIKLNIIDPILAHPVYNGWIKFFDEYFDLHVYSSRKSQVLADSKYMQLKCKKTLHCKTNFVSIYSDVQVDEDSYNIIGDIFSNTLCYKFKYLRSKKSVFYSEYYNDGKPRYKKLLFFVIGNIFFRNKKILVPHKLGEKTFKSISKNVFLLPELYSGKVLGCLKEKNDDIVRFIYVGRISGYLKNVTLLIDTFEKLDAKNSELLFVGKIFDLDDKYRRKLIDGMNPRIKYLGEKPFEEIENILQEGDALILASKFEPIGAVVQEAMANGCMPIVSNLAGASGYVEDGKSGFVFSPLTENGLFECMKKSFDLELLSKIKEGTLGKMKTCYSVDNQELLDDYNERFVSFLEK